MSWGVLDFNTNEASDFDATGGHFQSLSGHRYLVVVRAQDDLFSVQKMTLDGFGEFQCANLDEHSLQQIPAPHPLLASIPHQEFNNSGVAPTLQELVVIMDPDIGAFEYDKLSCGFHAFGAHGELEYIAFDGLMTFSATSVNSKGFTSSASLTTSPQP